MTDTHRSAGIKAAGTLIIVSSRMTLRLICCLAASVTVFLFATSSATAIIQSEIKPEGYIGWSQLLIKNLCGGFLLHPEIPTRNGIDDAEK
ncbi:hypothetical protein [Pantoea sp.]|uniref:hypothetical protein n=1 Tax=Pantoea sp. TaxID=69393 RepID=UPI002913E2F2|nr:hypothetical protein [Pantoea sp.]MDU4127504.1 hypothetical protein [Pantoea sp.]